MPFIPVENTAQVNIRYESANQSILENVIYFLRVLAWTAEDLADLLDSVSAGWDNQMRGDVSTAISLLNLSARDLTTENGLYAELAIAQPHAGTHAGGVLPASVTWAVKFTTGFIGRSFRGRSYFVGLTEADVEGDFLQGTVGADILASYAAWMAGIENSEFVTHVVVSRYTNGFPRVAGLATPVTAYSFTDTRVDTQRRRLSGTGQ